MLGFEFTDELDPEEEEGGFDDIGNCLISMVGVDNDCLHGVL